MKNFLCLLLLLCFLLPGKTASCSTDLNLTLFVEGFVDPVDNSVIQPALYNAGLSNDPTHVDEITVELHNSASPNNLEPGGTTTGTLKTNGELNVTFLNDFNGNYYIVVKGRNILETWSATALAFSSSGLNTYNFSSAATQAYDNNLVFISNKWMIRSGDVADNISNPNGHDGAIDAFDFPIIYQDIIIAAFGYLNSDLSGDGFVDLYDYLILQSNNENGSGIARPNYFPALPPGPFPSPIYDTWIKNVSVDGPNVITFEIWLELHDGVTPQHHLGFYQAGINFNDYDAFRNNGSITASFVSGSQVTGGNVNIDAVSHQLRIIDIMYDNELFAPLIPYHSQNGMLIKKIKLTNSVNFDPAIYTGLVSHPENYFSWSFNYGTKHTTRTGIGFYSDLQSYTNPAAFHVGNAASVPALSTWGLILLSALLISSGMFYIKNS